MRKLVKRAIRAVAKWADLVPPTPRKEADRPIGMRISYSALGTIAPAGSSVAEARAAQYSFPGVPPGVIPKQQKIALDSAMQDAFAFATVEGSFAEGLQFMGYPYLAELAQRAEYRKPVEIIAREMTRKWIKISSSGELDKTLRIEELKKEMERLNVRAHFRKAAEVDGLFGRAQIFIDTGKADRESDEEIKTALVAAPEKIKKHGIHRLQVVEPIWTYPGTYNSNDPLDPTFFKPQTWYVQGREIHHTRLLTFVSRPVPDLLKPAYAFGGLSLSQMAKPYVDNWLRTRQSVSDLVHAFSTWVLKTDMSQILEGGTDSSQLTLRAQIFNRFRDNHGILAVDKESEEFENIAAPLGGLDDLQAQAQEQQASVYGIPFVVMFGIAPKGLNASSDGDLRVFYSMIESAQESGFRPNLKRVIDAIMVSLWGEIDKDITFSFEPLFSLSDKDAADARKIEAETDGLLIDKGIIEPQEARKRIAGAEDSPYASLDLNKEIEPPGNEDDDLLSEFGLAAPAVAGFPAKPGAPKPGEPPAAKPVAKPTGKPAIAVPPKPAAVKKVPA